MNEINRLKRNSSQSDCDDQINKLRSDLEAFGGVHRYQEVN